MEKEELQINDLVYRPECYDEVVEIRSNGIIGLDQNRGLIPFSELKPIEITPKILEKNGFKKMSNSPYVMLFVWSTGGVAKFADVTIQVMQDHADKWRWDALGLKIHLYRGDITLYKIRYVHELQHALRLCKIDKKIEL